MVTTRGGLGNAIQWSICAQQTKRHRAKILPTNPSIKQWSILYKIIPSLTTPFSFLAFNLLSIVAVFSNTVDVVETSDCLSSSESSSSCSSSDARVNRRLIYISIKFKNTFFLIYIITLCFKTPVSAPTQDSETPLQDSTCRQIRKSEARKLILTIRILFI